MATRVDEYVAHAAARDLQRTISRGVVRGNLLTIGAIAGVLVLIAVLSAISQSVREALDPVNRRRAATAPRQVQTP